MLAGALLPGAWYVQAQRFRRWYGEQLARLFTQVDIVLAPATPCPAPRIGQNTMQLRGEQMLVRPNLGLYTQPISFAGLPVVAVPVPRPGELPIGVQVIAAPWREDLVLRVAAFLEGKGIAQAPLPAALG
jgi:Asp-tRNA(Asn)/Glu-tRNA(Gln) amidotransferase A subunit family amidase